jgi:hypothetical protein
MIIITRILVAVIGVIALLGVAQHWFSLDAVFAERGLQAVGGLFSVALSLKLLSPDVIRHRSSLEPGLSSP